MVRGLRLLLLVVGCAVAALTMGITTVAAQDADGPPSVGGLKVSTPYPVVAVQAGDQITINLAVTAPSPTEVSLTITESPDGWDFGIRGGGFAIGGVTASPDAPPNVELRVNVAPDTTGGRYSLVVAAEGVGVSDELELEFVVTEVEVNGVSLNADFPTIRGASTDVFTYQLTIENQTPSETTFNFAPRGPEGWLVTAGPAAEARASTVTVAAGGTEQVQVNADPPDTLDAGTYPIFIGVEGGDQQGGIELTAVVSGQASLLLLTEGQRLDAKGQAGSTIELPVLVTNDGSSTLTEIILTQAPPEGWDVEWEPSRITQLDPGSVTQAVVRITPDSDAVAGDYSLSLTGDGVSSDSATARDTIDIRYTVSTSRWWGALGIAVIAAALAVLLGVFRRYGRR